jgi:hypothetical protein
MYGVHGRHDVSNRAGNEIERGGTVDRHFGRVAAQRHFAVARVNRKVLEDVDLANGEQEVPGAGAAAHKPGLTGDPRPADGGTVAPPDIQFAHDIEGGDIARHVEEGPGAACPRKILTDGETAR